MKCDDFEALHIEMHVHTSNLNIVRDCFEGDKENWLLITFEFTEGEGGGVWTISHNKTKDFVHFLKQRWYIN